MKLGEAKNQGPGFMLQGIMIKIIIMIIIIIMMIINDSVWWTCITFIPFQFSGLWGRD